MTAESQSLWARWRSAGGDDHDPRGPRHDGPHVGRCLVAKPVRLVTNIGMGSTGSADRSTTADAGRGPNVVAAVGRSVTFGLGREVGFAVVALPPDGASAAL